VGKQLFGDDQQGKLKTNVIKTDPVKKCQRVLNFINTESDIKKDLFNANPKKKELCKLHKQVLNIFLYIIII